MAQREFQPAVNLAEIEERARQILPGDVFDHVAGGASDEITLKENIAAFRRVRLLPRVLQDVADRSLGVTIIGEKIDLPVILAPIACLRRFHPEGELAAVRAAGTGGTICILSTGSCYRLEDVAQAAPGPLWFQLYAYRDRGLTRHLVERAAAAGYRAICLTVDVPVGGRRERDLRNGYIYPKDLLYQSMAAAGFSRQDLEAEIDRLPAFSASALSVPLTWDYVEWLRSLSGLPFLLKGILSAEDAARAASVGIQGIVVSNHGGRQLDGVPAAIDVLPSVVDAVQGRTEVLLDSGVRRGTDILKALALGAKAVLVGRPYVWGLAAAGQSGVSRVLEILREELENAMALAGCSAAADIDRSLIWSNRG
jgi:4-hydroxymandelate oxidase